MDVNKLTTDQSIKNELIERRRGFYEIENYRAEWKPEELDLLKELFEDGCGISEIAVKLKRSELATIQRIQENKLFREIKNKDPHKQNADKCKCRKCEMRLNCTKNSEFCTQASA